MVENPNEKKLGRNRREDRFLKGNKYGISNSSPQGAVVSNRETVLVQPAAALLELDADIETCQIELGNYNNAIPRIEASFKIYRFFRSMGASEERLRRLALSNESPESEYNPTSEWISLTQEMDPRKFAASQQVFRMLLKRDDPKKAYKFEDADEWRALLEDREIPLEDLFIESLRVRRGEKDLLESHITWLKEEIEKREPVLQDKQDADESSGVIEDTSGVEDNRDEIPFLLQGWNLFWTDRFWSRNPNHFRVVPTASREQALEAIELVSRGQIMVKAGSVLRALEFHLKKDVIQKALSTTLKYGPIERREWVKIKRGRDRIMFLIPDPNEATAIFFAANRDIIYRDN